MSTTLDNTTTLDHPTVLGQDAQQETPAAATANVTVAQSSCAPEADPVVAVVDYATCPEALAEMVDAAPKPEGEAAESPERSRKRKREGGSDPSLTAESDVQSTDEGDKLKSLEVERPNEEPEAKRRATDEDVAAADPEAPEQHTEADEGNPSQTPATPLMIGEKVLPADAQDSHAEALKVEE